MLIDQQQILNEYGQDFDIFEEFFEAFLEQSDDFIEQIEKAANEKNCEQLSLHAHTLKGMIVNFYCEQLKLHLISIEKAAGENDLGEINASVQTLKDLNTQMINELKIFVQQHNL